MRTCHILLHMTTYILALAKDHEGEANCGEKGWHAFRSQCYFVGKVLTTRRLATASCHALGAHLTSVHSPAELDFLLTLLQENADGVWLGLVENDENKREGGWSWLAGLRRKRSWRWSDGSTLTYSNWETPQHPPEPPNCISLHPPTSHWLPIHCRHLLQYVCKRPCSSDCQSILPLEDTAEGSWSGERVGSLGNVESLNKELLHPMPLSLTPPVASDGGNKRRRKEAEVVLDTVLLSTPKEGCKRACGKTFYRLSMTLKTLQEAREDCVAGGGTVTGLVQSLPPKLARRLRALRAPVWVGSGGPVTWTPPSAGASQGHHHSAAPCRVAVPGSGRWALTPCHGRHHYLCQYTRRDSNTITLTTTQHAFTSATTSLTTIPVSVTPPPRRLCAPGWLVSGGRCYRLYSKWMTWQSAENTCRSHGGHLASIGDPSEQVALRSLYLARLVPGPLWVGLRRSEDSAEGFRWVDGSPSQAWVWGRGQPDEHLGREECGALSLPSLTLQDAVCLARMPFLCEDAPGSRIRGGAKPLPATPQNELCGGDPAWLLFGDHCYSLVGDEEPLPWWEAQRRCTNEGAQLASIHTLEENYWLQAKVLWLGVGAVWTGGRVWVQEEGYRWLDGTPFNFSNWAPGEPNNLHDQEGCLALYTHRQGYWNDQNCGSPEGRVCKRPLAPVSVSAPAPTLATTKTFHQGYCPPGWTSATGVKCYKYFSEPQHFDGARDTCRRERKGGELASVHTSAQAAYLTVLAGGGEAGAWLGLRRQVRRFLWLDQTPVNFTRWAAGEPSGAQVRSAGRRKQQTEECVEVQTHGRAGLWNDLSCSERRPYVCQAPQQEHRPEHPSTSTTASTLSAAPPTSCPPPYHHYQRRGDHCYRAFTSPHTWQAAEETCVGEGAHLATVRTRREAATAWVMVIEAALKDPWLGLHREQETKDFKWSSGWPLLHAPWSNNNNNNNNNSSSSSTEGSCVALLSSSGEWLALRCPSLRPFLCQVMMDLPGVSVGVSANPCPDSRWLHFGASFCYLVVREPRPWHDARHTCFLEDGDLISVTSVSEMALLTMAVHDVTQAVWIGLLHEEEGFQWSDGAAFTYSHWHKNEPNGGAGLCVEVYSGSGTWNDVECSQVRPFVCKHATD